MAVLLLQLGNRNFQHYFFADARVGLQRLDRDDSGLMTEAFSDQRVVTGVARKLGAEPAKSIGEFEEQVRKLGLFRPLTGIDKLIYDDLLEARRTAEQDEAVRPK
jgi:hypothetical protein